MTPLREGFNAYGPESRQRYPHLPLSQLCHRVIA
jgi:hypothetical protein